MTTLPQLKKAFYARFPVNGQALFNLCYALVDDYGYGGWDKYRPKHRNNQKGHNKHGRYTKLGKYRIHRHILCGRGEKEALLYYTNALFLLLDGTRLFVPMLDLDDKLGVHGQALMEEAAGFIRELHPAFGRALLAGLNVGYRSSRLSLSERAGTRRFRPVVGSTACARRRRRRSEKIDPLVTSMFLSHSVRDMKSHYALRNWEALDRATDLLERVFDLAAASEAEAA